MKSSLVMNYLSTAPEKIKLLFGEICGIRKYFSGHPFTKGNVIAQQIMRRIEDQSDCNAATMRSYLIELLHYIDNHQQHYGVVPSAQGDTA